MTTSAPKLSSEHIEKFINHALANGSLLEQQLFTKAMAIAQAGLVSLLSRSLSQFTFSVEDNHFDHKVTLNISNETADNEPISIQLNCTCRSHRFCIHKWATLIEVKEMLANEQLKEEEFQEVGKQYTREGMIERVLSERLLKARSEGLTFFAGANMFGPHTVNNRNSVKYEVMFHDMDIESGYCTCPDFRTNKLGTCKHLMFAYLHIKDSASSLKILSQVFPFVDIFINPHNHQEINWFYPEPLDKDTEDFISKYFGDDNSIALNDDVDLSKFILEAQYFRHLYVRKGLNEWQQKQADQQLLTRLFSTINLKYDSLKEDLYPYQKRGIEFIAARSGAILADEMGLGKTIQAIGSAIIKHQVLGFKKTLIICPASLKSQWLSEINRFTNSEGIIVDGFPAERKQKYLAEDFAFYIINYETVLRDLAIINKADFDFVIVDEAQRIKNYQTQISNAIRRIRCKHTLALTGTPLENKLIDLYPIVEFVSPGTLSPLWEFSYQHCYFDNKNLLQINGYYNLNALKERLSSIILRRTKMQVLKEINKLNQIDIPIVMHPEQRDLHSNAAKTVASILRKKFRTSFDMQLLMAKLQVMRMVCDSSFLVDKETHHSPKMKELEHILFEQFNIKEENKKIIIFSEWKQMLQIISYMLSTHGITHVRLSGNVPVKKRHLLFSEFSDNPDCKIFLSTEAGGSGLNLQAADTVINFELPWNPAKKNQRIGRIDRIGQKNKHLTVINFITRDSIEMSIASGLLVKQNLFESVLDDNNLQDYVDFSSKGRAQFLKDLEITIENFESATYNAEVEKILAEEDIKTTLDTNEEFEEEATITGGSGEEQVAVAQSEASDKESNIEQMEEVMNAGMNFLAGMFKMATGKEMSATNKVEIDKETGEVVFRFKI